MDRRATATKRTPASERRGMISRTVVCGVDRSAGACAAARVAAALARRLGMRLELLHVCEPVGEPEAGVIDIDAVQLALDGRLEVSDADVRVDAGRVPERLTAAASDAALLVVGSPSNTGLRDSLFGIAADAVARAPARPVVVVPPSASRRLGLDPLVGRTVACGVRDERDAASARVAADLVRPRGVAHPRAHVVCPTGGEPDRPGRA